MEGNPDKVYSHKAISTGMMQKKKMENTQALSQAIMQATIETAKLVVQTL